MSEGKRMSLSFARMLAGKMVDLLRPHCERIEVAGLIRRCTPTVGDIEIVCIPRMIEIADLFGTPLRNRDHAAITSALLADGFGLEKDGPHFKQVRLPQGSVNFDIFLTSPECWGVIFLIRTGSADFSHLMVTPRNQGGHMPSNLRVKDGRVWHGDQALDTPEEKDVFDCWNMDFIEPRNRTI